MEWIVGKRVEMPVESQRRRSGSETLRVCLLGPMAIARGGSAVALPASRKVRALFAYLALSPHAVARTQLCELLWDVPNDPRGELRWCLSKIRSFAGASRVAADGDMVRLDLAGCWVDALEVARAAQAGIDALPHERLQALIDLFAGDFLEGLEIDRSPVFNGWLVAQRRRFRGCHAALLETLARRVPDDDALAPLEK
jgi:DNA-binding SARP family transcriptional activator